MQVFTVHKSSFLILNMFMICYSVRSTTKHETKHIFNVLLTILKLLKKPIYISFFLLPNTIQVYVDNPTILGRPKIKRLKSHDALSLN